MFLDLFKKFFNKKQPKLGLALGSGGAKGAALIGSLKAFNEANVKFDCVTGTSIGSIVGALYALGFSTEKMTEILKDYNLTNRLRLVKMTLKKGELTKTLQKIFKNATFQDTLIPFQAVACDIESGEQVVLKSGKLYKALAASCAIPPVFKPVTIDKRRLIDGAFVNAVPADLLKGLGADIVISVALHNKKSNASIKRYLDKLYRANGVKTTNRLYALKSSDYTIFPELDRFTASNVKSFQTIYQIGYDETKRCLPYIKQIIKNKRNYI